MTWLFYLVWPVVSTYFKTAFKLWKIPGKEKIPEGGKIFAVNHCSNADGVILNLLKYEPVRFLGKIELFRLPHQRIAMKGVGTIPIKRGKGDVEALEDAINALKKGVSVGIFPEGTRSDGTRIIPPHTGVIRLALLAEVPIIPVGISGAKRSWPKGRFLPRFGRKIEVKIGKPWIVPRPPDGREYTYDELKELARILMYEKVEPLVDHTKNT